jgi:hypothetical protein
MCLLKAKHLVCKPILWQAVYNTIKACEKTIHNLYIFNTSYKVTWDGASNGELLSKGIYGLWTPGAGDNSAGHGADISIQLWHASSQFYDAHFGRNLLRLVGLLL